MKVIVYGATGMVGQGVLRECLLDPDVGKVLAVGRSKTGRSHEKLQELLLGDLTNLSSVEGELAGADACFFCLGVSSAGMSEAAYRKVTYDIALAAARVFVKVAPDVTFVYVSGEGTDSTGKGRSMWARVKGETENALLAMPLKAAYMFRPGFIEPLHGSVSRTKSYRILYKVARPLLPLLRAVAPDHVTTTETLAKAMLVVAKRGYPKQVLATRDINRVGIPV